MNITIAGEYPDKEKMQSIIRKVIERHPLNAGILTLDDITSLNIVVKITDDFSCLNVDSSQFPCITLQVDLWRYPSTNLDSTFCLHAYHEFTHVIDRQNSDFGLTAQKEAEIKGREDAFKKTHRFSIFVDLWNCYIDGRLERKGIIVKTLAERLEEIPQQLPQPVSAALTEACQKAWNSDRLTAGDLLDLASRCIDKFQETWEATSG